MFQYLKTPGCLIHNLQQKSLDMHFFNILISTRLEIIVTNYSHNSNIAGIGFLLVPNLSGGTISASRWIDLGTLLSTPSAAEDFAASDGCSVTIR